MLNALHNTKGILQDADFCLKVRQLGFKVFHDPQSRVFVLPTAGSPSKKWYAKGKQEEEFYGKWSRVLHRSTVPYLNLRVVWDLYCIMKSKLSVTRFLLFYGKKI